MKQKVWPPLVGAMMTMGGVAANAATCTDAINGVVPSSGQCYKGHFNFDRKIDILVQAQNPSGTHAIYLADPVRGTYITPAHQTWTDNYLNLNWSASEVRLVVEDYNHDRRADVRVVPLTGTVGSAIIYGQADATINPPNGAVAAKNYLFMQDFEAAALTDYSGQPEPGASDNMFNYIRKLFPGTLNQIGPHDATTFTAGSVLSRLSVAYELGYTGNRVFRQKYPSYAVKLGEVNRTTGAVSGSGAQFVNVLRDMVNGSSSVDRQVYMAYDIKFNSVDYGITLGSSLAASAGPGSVITLAGPAGVFDPTAYEKISTLNAQKSFPTGNPRTYVEDANGKPVIGSDGYIVFQEAYNRGWAGEIIINNEVIRYKSRSGNKAIIDKRGVRGTVAANHNAGSKVKLGFDFMQGFKMPGFKGGDRGWTGGKCVPSTPSASCDSKYGKAFIARFNAGFDHSTTPDTSGYPVVYTYTKDRYEYGEFLDLTGTRAEFKHDTWHRVEYMVKLNTVTNGQANRNGQIKVWLDGKLAYDRSNFAFYDDPSLIVNWFLSTSHFGGTSNSSRTQKVELRDSDNFVISDKPIWGAYAP